MRNEKLSLSRFDFRKLYVSPSMLASDFSRLAEQLGEIETAGADFVHLDVMDGVFVPNITIGPAVVKSMRPHSALPFDVHLMIVDPIRYVKDFAEAGADHITFHVESEGDPIRTIQAIHEAGCSAGITLKPATPASAIEPYLSLIDMVLVMSVEPGFGGQSFQPEQLKKASEIRSMLRAVGSRAHIEMDGGLGIRNVRDAARAGVNVVVAGTSVFRAESGIGAAIESLHAAQDSLDAGCAASL